MKKFNHLTAIAAPLDVLNIDTDMIIPKQFLKTIKRTGLGKSLFYEMRTFQNGETNPEFILNKQPFNEAQILVVSDNFGCGSSREHAPWALVDFGISCVIAPSFADIFYNNCFENGILPAKIPNAQKDKIIDFLNTAKNPTVSVNLVEQTIEYDNETIEFSIDIIRKNRLLNGLDSIGLSLEYCNNIDAFEHSMKQQTSWL
jgi:3-isopropylmalate/(R)-2-methylmalate dehydratase small subunit